MQQTRNVIHTELCSKGEKEKNEKEHTQDYVVHLEKGYIHGREKQKAFIMVAIYKWKLILYVKYRASLPYINKGQNRKITK